MSDGINTAAPAPRSNPAAAFARDSQAGSANAPAPKPAAVSAAAAPAAPPQDPDLRLNIEHDAASGSFVYKFVNPATGQVVQQFPTEEILKLRAAAEYSAGRVVSTRA